MDGSDCNLGHMVFRPDLQETAAEDAFVFHDFAGAGWPADALHLLFVGLITTMFSLVGNVLPVTYFRR